MLFRSDQVATTSFSIPYAGRYLISFDGVGSASGTTTGSVTAQLFVNGVAKPGAIASATSSGTTDVENINFNTMITVLPSCEMIDNSVTLTVVNTGVGTTYANTILTITKLA